MQHPDILLKAPHALFINGVWARPHTERKVKIISPVTEEVFLTVAEATDPDIAHAVAAARAAFEAGEWPRMTASERGRVLLSKNTPSSRSAVETTVASRRWEGPDPYFELKRVYFA
jgi:hypothetical protein